MATTVLVAGLLPYESGKTWFTLSSALYVRKLGYSVRVVKPVAGHNLWYSPRTIKKSLKHRMLLGNDILAYYEHGLIEELAIGNPIAIATIPLDPSNYHGDIGRYMAEMEQISTIMALARLTNCHNRETVHYYFPENLVKTTSYMRRKIERIAVELNARAHDPRRFIDILASREIEENLEVCLNIVAGDIDILFIESFNDAVVPYMRLLDHVDYLIVVSPGRVFLYDDVEAVRKLIEEHTVRLGIEGLRARWIIERVKPALSVETTLIARPTIGRQHKLLVERITSR